MTPEMDIIKLSSKLTVDVIAEAAFGCDSQSFVQETSKFEDMAKTLMKPVTLMGMLKFIVVMIIPKLEKVIDTGFVSEEADGFFSGLINSSMKYRQEKNVKGNDFLQLMMEVKDGQIKKENDSELNEFEKDAILKNVDDKANFDDDSIIAQLLLFFLAGFDTTKSFMIFALYNLALNPEVQDKLLDEILDTVDSNGDLSYESINGMEYLEKFTNGEKILKFYRKNVVLYKFIIFLCLQSHLECIHLVLQ